MVLGVFLRESAWNRRLLGHRHEAVLCSGGHIAKQDVIVQTRPVNIVLHLLDFFVSWDLTRVVSFLWCWDQFLNPRSPMLHFHPNKCCLPSSNPSVGAFCTTSVFNRLLELLTQRPSCCVGSWSNVLSCMFYSFWVTLWWPAKKLMFTSPTHNRSSPNQNCTLSLMSQMILPGGG